MFSPYNQKTQKQKSYFQIYSSDKESFAEPKLPYLSAACTLAKFVPGLEVDFDHFGAIRCLTSSASEGLYKTSYSSDPSQTACALLETPLMRRALGLKHTDIALSKETRFGFGYRVDFKQVASSPEMGSPIPVRGGAITVSLDWLGRVFSITSTLRRGRKQSQAGRIIPQAEAIARAAESFRQPINAANCRLIYSSHNGQMDLAYDVTLVSDTPRDVVSYLVLAKTGRIVDQQFKLWRSSEICSTIGVGAKALLCTPDPSQPITPQVSKTVIARLPNPGVLRNEYLAMFLGHERRPVLAKSDGSYCYGVKDPEFAAVSVFIALDRQLKLYLALGMRVPDRVLSVFVNDPTVSDNAYFDQTNYEMRIGVGSGLKHGGLNKNIAFDLGVSNHEFGHNAVFLQTAGQDLPGIEGAAMHEATGDVLGTLLMDYLHRIWQARQQEHQFTVEDLTLDRRLVGKYAQPPKGLRSQLNTRRAPYDMTGEPHSDGLIAGGAFADTLVGMALAPRTLLEDQLKLFARINLTALALVPAHKVSFKDMLRAFITADYLETTGKYRELIEQCFAAHGIAFGASTNRFTSDEAA